MPTPSSDTAAVRQIIRALIRSGHTLRWVDDGEDTTVATTESTAIEAIMSVDDSTMVVALPDGITEGWVRFVLGNYPEEVEYHTTNLSPTLDALIDTW